MSDFKFNISLTVLNHLGRNLYRNFITVLGEAISNSWDANARNVYITIDLAKDYFVVQDDGVGMSAEDFTNKFLKIGYSKRTHLDASQSKKRPIIGQKGIGKLALLSYSEVITICSKRERHELVGGIINNKELDEAIRDDSDANQYILGALNGEEYLAQQGLSIDTTGTIIIFEGLNNTVKNTIEYIRKLVALYYKFSLYDKEFKIHFNGTLVTIEDLKDLIDETQFVWSIDNPDDNIKDPFLTKIWSKCVGEKCRRKSLDFSIRGVRGYIASVSRPSKLTIRGTQEKATIDLFVNGRLREKNIMPHISSNRVAESYLYGQIHYDALDDGTLKDRFPSARDGVLPGDDLYERLCAELKKLLSSEIYPQWDAWRIEINQDGDPDENSISASERKIDEAFNREVEEYTNSIKDQELKEVLKKQLASIKADAQFNISAYMNCFIVENLLRWRLTQIVDPVEKKAEDKAQRHKNTELSNKEQAGMPDLNIREGGSNLLYLDASELISLIPESTGRSELEILAKEYRPVRNAMAHTSRLTSDAKTLLKKTYISLKRLIIDMPKL